MQTFLVLTSIRQIHNVAVALMGPSRECINGVYALTNSNSILVAPHKGGNKVSCGDFLSQFGLLFGFVASILLFFSQKVGTIMADDRIRYDGLDDLAPADEKKRKVRSSHWRNKWFTPIGWILLSLAFLLQLISHHI